ncbi:hypothetical protein GCM10020255_018730 [Rhodococcus baikonurensis]
MLGTASRAEPVKSLFQGSDISFLLPDARATIGGGRLPAGAWPTLAPGLNIADRDLGLRLLNRPATAPWWSLELRDTALESPTGAQTRARRAGASNPS